MLWLLAARKKKPLRPLRLLSKHRLLQPPTQLLPPRPLPTLLLPPLRLTLLLPLRLLPRPLLTLLLLLRPLLRKLLTLLLPSNQRKLDSKDRPAGRFFYACGFIVGWAESARRTTAHKKTGPQAGFSCEALN